jgi:hypothetical protein
MSGYILPGGNFEVAYEKLRRRPVSTDNRELAKDREAKADSKTKYTCPDCAQNAWAIG